MPDIRYLARDADGNFYWLPWPQEIAGAPEVLAPPAIGGTIAPGQTVTRIPGMYAGDPTPTLARAEWTLRDASGAIAGQHTGDSYKIPPGAPNGSLELVEVMSGVGSLQARGVVQASVTAIVGLPEFTSNPRISGSAVVGQTLTRVRGVATGSPAPTITDQWLRDWVPIPGATGASYQSTPEDIGKVIGLRNQAANSVSNAVGLLVYALATVGIKITANPAIAPVITSGPTIVYDPDNAKFSLGSIAVSGTPTPEVSYLWHTAASATATLVPRSQGATKNPTEWAPNPALYPRGTYFALQATAANAAGTDVEMSARLQFPSQEGFSVNPVLSGSAPAGNTLTVAHTAHGSPRSTAYTWLRSSRTEPLSNTGNTRKTGDDDVDATLTVEVTLTYASGAVFTKVTNGIKVTAATGLVFPAISNMTSATAAGSVLSKGPFDYRVSHDGYVAELQNPDWGMALQLIGYEAWRGNTLAQTELVTRLTRWAQPTTSPIMAGGYQMQHMANFASNAAYGRRTPAVWDALTSTVQNRITGLMRLALWTIGLWREGTESRNTRLGTNNATTASVGSNPNIACAPSYVWYAAAWFFGGVANALDYVDDNDLADLIATFAPVKTAKPNNLNLANAYACWTASPSGAPTNAQVQSRARDRQSRRGIALTNPLGVLCAEIDHACRLAAARGINGGAGLRDNEYYNGSDSSDYVSSALTTRYPGHTKEGRMFKDPAVVAKTRWEAIEGKTGMIAEFDSNDGNPGRRSSITYALKAHPSVFGHIMLQFSAGFCTPSDLKTRRDKLFVCHEHMTFATELCGYDGVAHIYAAQPGQPNTIGKHGNSGNIEPTTTDMNRYCILSRLSLGAAVIDMIPAA